MPRDSYLLSSGVLSEPNEHLQLSKLCLEQFCLSEFDDTLATADVEQHVQEGAFAFFEYSLVNWASHFLERLKQGEQRNTSSLAEPEVEEFVELLGIFLDVHWVKPKRKARIKSSMVSAVRSLPGLEADYRVQLLQTVASVKGFTSFELQDPICYETLKLYSILRKVRLAIENLAQDPSTRTTLEQFYGESVFKCPRLYCKWFYEGFQTAQKREEHLAKHERAYYCSYIGCLHATVGCKTADELEAHHQTHKPPETCDDFFPNPVAIGSMASPVANSPASNTFANNASANSASVANVPPANIPMASSIAQSANTPNSTAMKRTASTAMATREPPPKRSRPIGPFACNACPKVFQRLPHLRSHQRTHTDDKPFACTTCGKRFARQPDLTRHRASHTKNKKFSCAGQLQDGRPWGCGKSFARADGLARHFKGDAGKLCVKPLSDESLQQSVQNTAAPSNSAVTSASTGGSHVSASPHAPGHDPYTTNAIDPDLLTMGWRQLPPISQLGLTAPSDRYMIGDDDPYPDSLYQQHPVLAGINWDALPPEHP